MGHFYFVRHGQTVWNVENKICGATDSPLTEHGRQQAAETGKNIVESGIKADEILYSPLSRAADTAKIISEMSGIPCREEPRLIEQNFGKWESTPRDGKEFKKAKESFACRYEGGESMLQLAQRIYNLLDEIKQESDHKTYILVAHNGISRMIQSYFTDMTNEEFASFGVKNCQVAPYIRAREFIREENKNFSLFCMTFSKKKKTLITLSLLISIATSFRKYTM